VSVYQNNNGLMEMVNKGFCRLAFLLLAFTSLPACKLIIELPEGGYVQSSSSNFDCRAELSSQQLASASPQRRLYSSGSFLTPTHTDSFHCEFDISDTSFDEVFTAVPHEGYKFTHWRKVERGLFGGATDNGVYLFTTGSR